MRENQCNAATPMVIKSYLRKAFTDIVANELEERIIQAICGPRSKHKVDVAQRLLKILVDVTGEDCTLKTPKTGTQRIMVFMADQMAVWMIDAVEAADNSFVDRKEKSLQGTEDGGKGDTNYEEEEERQSEQEVQIIHKKKRPSKVNLRSEGAGDGALEPSSKGGKKPATTKMRGAEDNDGSDVKATQPKPAAKGKKPSSEGDGGKYAQAKTLKSQPQRKEGPKKGEAEKSPKTAIQRPSQAGPKRSSDRTSTAQAKRYASQKPASGGAGNGKKSSAKPGTTQSSRSIISRKSSQTASKQDVGNSAAPAKTSSQQFSKSESRAVTDPRRGSKAFEKRPRTASELQREMTGEVISAHISTLIKEGSSRDTPRAAALKDVISKKLEGSTTLLDQKGINAIKDASILLAAFIDKQAETIELEYGNTQPAKAFAQRGKGPVFSVKQAESSLAIKQITHTEAAAEISRARGRPVSGAISLSKIGFDSKETREWAKWANDVVNMADKWSKWIDSTVTKAVKSAEMKKAGLEVPEWCDWKKKAGEEALEWRRNKKLLNQSAALFQDKVDHTNKPRIAPALGSSQAPRSPPNEK